jgi:preprotein translocase subunit SecA
MYLGDSEKKKVNSALLESYEKVLYEIEKEEETIISSFDRDIEKILGKTLLNYLIENNYIKVKNIDGKVVGDRVLENFHYSDIPTDQTFIKQDGTEISIGEYYKERVSKYLSIKTKEYKEELGSELDEKKFDKNMPKILALASIGLTTFHRRRDMHLRDVQKLAGIGMCYGEIAELGTGEGKTVAAVLPAFMHALRGKGVHVVTANSYLSRRDYEELKPVYEGLGLTVGYVRSQAEDSHDGLELKASKRNAYNCDITYSAKDEIAFDYLRDSIASLIEDVVTREGKPGFAIIDEVDDALVDSASSPYIIAGTPPYYKNSMTLKDIANVMALPLNKVTEQLELRGMDTSTTKEYSYEEAVTVAELFSKEIYLDNHDKLITTQTFYNIVRFSKVNIDPEDMKVFDKYHDLFTMENGVLRVHDKRLFRLLASNTTSDDSAYYFGKYKFTPDEV